MTAAEILLIRHAEATCNVTDVIGGPTGCTGLTDRGRTQAALLAERLLDDGIGGVHPAILYSSPRLRARQTAQVLATKAQLTLHIEPDLREQDFGSADGKPRSSLYDPEGGNPVLHPWRVPAPGAESWSTHRGRIERVLGRLTRAHPGSSLILICHGETVNAAHHVFFELPEAWPGPLPLTVGNTAITRWRHAPWVEQLPQLGTRWDLQAHNDMAHLAGDRTGP